MAATVSAPRRRRPSEEALVRQQAFREALRHCPHDGHWVPADHDPDLMVRCACYRRALAAKHAPVAQPLPLTGRVR